MNMRDYPTSYKVKDKFGEVHTQCNCIVLITVKKAEERFKEAVKEERGCVDLFGNYSSQSQMSGYSPPFPPPRRKKRRHSKNRRRSEESRHRVDDDDSRGTTTVVAATVGGGKASEGGR